MYITIPRLIISAVFLCASLSVTSAADIRLQPGMVIRESSTIIRDRYTLNAKSNLTEALIEIAGNDLVIDFNASVLQGSNNISRPDEMYGLAIRIRKGSKNITIKNAFVHGYKVAIFADSVENLILSNCDLSYNWRQHLKSNLNREDISDWMSFHRNENDEWMRYGAAIYLKNCKKAIITNNTVTGGQCALMMTLCENAEISDNNFSFNSGIGIGMYRSSNNKIYHNRLDYNVRGYSHNKYHRGQDSAAILVFEQCNNNIFAFNTATHGGDGFFLWAGQTTMDTGTGGCNDNFIYGNDFSYAPTNGIEITFSRNLIMKNTVNHCDHGIWGGYSFDTDITDNRFENNRIGIAIEHGQNINIALNAFTGGKTGIKLWSREKQPADWAYARLRNTESRNYWIAANRFTSLPTALDIMGTDTVVLQGNTKVNVGQHLLLGDRWDNIDTSREAEFLDIDYQKDERLKTITATELPAIAIPHGKSEMRITEWGPYDFRYPLLWLKNTDSTGLHYFEVLGPKGKWEETRHSGFKIVDKGPDSFPSYLTALPDTTVEEREIRLQYNGDAFINVFGGKTENNARTSFTYSQFQPAFRWNISWYRWDAAHDPARGYAGFETIVDQSPVSAVAANKVDYTWWGAIGTNLPADSFATIATSTVQLPAGIYDIGITADDYAKVFVDEKEVIDAWDSKYTERDEDTHHRSRISLAAGRHTFKIVHAENRGLATLMFYINPLKNPNSK